MGEEEENKQKEEKKKITIAKYLQVSKQACCCP
jgi:hypothetical protein